MMYILVPLTLRYFYTNSIKVLLYFLQKATQWINRTIILFTGFMIFQEMKTDRNRVGGGHEIQRGLHLMLAKWINLWMKMYSFREMCLFLLQVTALKCLAGVLTFNNSQPLLITKQHNERVPHSSEQRILPKEAEHSVHPIHKYLGVTSQKGDYSCPTSSICFVRTTNPNSRYTQVSFIFVSMCMKYNGSLETFHFVQYFCSFQLMNRWASN